MAAKNAGLFVVMLLVTLTLFPGCSGDANTMSDDAAPVVPTDSQPAPPMAGLTMLPVDRPQPREQLDENGFVIPGRIVSGINQDSEFVPGVEHFDASFGVVDRGEAVQIDSNAGGSGVSWAYWRLTMGGMEPGVISADVNLFENNEYPSEYYLGIANYADARWEWYGPYDEGHVRVSTAGAVSDGMSFLSGLGNAFIAVVAYDGAHVEVVGVGANPIDPLDTISPPAPTGLTAVDSMFGVEFQWNDVIDSDIAGYQFYWATQPITSTFDSGLTRLGYLEGGRRSFLSLEDGIDGHIFVRVACVDISGNVSLLSNEVELDLSILDHSPMVLEADSPSVLVGERARLTVTVGPMPLDWDLDGDGIYEITDDYSGTQYADTDGTGVIRPRVRCETNQGWCVATAAVSLLVTSNARPSARAYAIPASGPVPLNVIFTGEGWDGDGSIVFYDWDFDGDGTWDYSSDTDPNPSSAEQYGIAGMYNAKFRVEDDKGAFDVDTVSIYAESAGGGNTDPTAVIAIGAGEESGSTPHSVIFNFVGSSDAEGPIAEYHLDVDGDGNFDVFTTSQTYGHTYTEGGVFGPTLMVVDADGASDTDWVQITVNNVPEAICVASKYTVRPMETFTLDSSGSSDAEGAISGYEYDFDGDGVHEFIEADPYISYYYMGPGVYEIDVAVFDSDMAYDYTTVTITVEGWSSNSIDYDLINNVGQFCDLALVHGFPAIVYKDATNNAVLYSIGSDADGGQSWSSPVTIETLGSNVVSTRLAVVDGHPAIAYFDVAANEITYVRAADPFGATWGTPVDIDYLGGVGGIGLDLDLEIISGKPAISCCAGTTSWDLAFLISNDIKGLTWGAPVIIDSSPTDDEGYSSSLCVVDGWPAISYQASNTTTYDLKYVISTHGDGATWDTPVVVDTGSNMAMHTTLKIVDGRPAIAYDEIDTGEVRYIIANDREGASWPASGQVISSVTGVKEGVSFTVLDGMPAVSWIQGPTDDLVYSHALDTEGANWSVPFTVDHYANYGLFTSFEVVDNRLGMAVYETDDEVLKFWQLY